MSSSAHLPRDARVSGNPQDGYVVHTAGGTRIELDRHGFVADLPVIRSVGLIDLCEVASHQVHRAVGSTFHVLHFLNGGHVHFAYNDRGELLVLEGRAFRVQGDDDGHLRVGAWDSGAAGG